MIDKNFVLEIHTLIEQLGECAPGILKEDLLDSAIAGQVYYDSLAAQLLHVSSSINCEHIFRDGNKRTAYLILRELEEEYTFVDYEKLSYLILELAKSKISKEKFMEEALSCIDLP